MGKPMQKNKIAIAVSAALSPNENTPILLKGMITSVVTPHAASAINNALKSMLLRSSDIRGNNLK